MTKRNTEYEASVLAHIAAHEAKGETEAVEVHMESPIHRAIVEAADDTDDTDAETLAEQDPPVGADDVDIYGEPKKDGKQ